MSSKYRIITHSGSVHVQQQWTFLWWRGWSYVNGYSGGYQPYPWEFCTVETAKEYIDRQLAQQALWNQPRIITPYPALLSANQPLKPS